MPARAAFAALAPAALAAALLAAPAAAQHGHHGGSHAQVGTVDFRASCAPASQEDFDHAVALLHHMMYPEARAAFEAVAARDPGCAMAHWGVAMSLFQPLWPARPGPETLRRGWEAVQAAEALHPATGRERALLAAAREFYREPESADWWTRIRRWSASLEQSHRAYPGDEEIAAFHALSLLATAMAAEPGERLELHARAAPLLLAVHERVPDHPGAMHYTIHANDVTGRQEESLEIVRGYESIAPSVPHALHMPTHIFVRLGDWPGVIEWNRRSADAALEFPAGDRVSLHHAHALDYLLYAHLQRGDDRAAAAVLEEARGAGRYQEDFITAFHLAIMPARHAVERRAWEEAAALPPRPADYLPWERYSWADAIGVFAPGLGAARSGDLPAARRAAARLVEIRDAARAAGEEGFATYIEIDRLILAGYLAHAEGDADAALGHLRRAAELEGTVQKHPITPGALLPPYEALGDLLLELERPAEALAAYEAGLGVWPARYRSLLGAARAAAAAGDRGAARRHYAALLEVVGEVESARPGVEEARAALR